MVERIWIKDVGSVPPETAQPVGRDPGKSSGKEAPKGECYDGDLDEDEAIFDAAWEQLRREGHIK